MNNKPPSQNHSIRANGKVRGFSTYTRNPMTHTELKKIITESVEKADMLKDQLAHALNNQKQRTKP
jgi:hypothetical protein